MRPLSFQPLDSSVPLILSHLKIRDPSRGASNFGGYSINYEEADYARQGFGFEDDASSRDSSSGRDSSGISSSSSSGSSSSATSSSSSSQSHRDDSADNINPASSTTTFPIVTLDNVLSAEFNHRCPSLIKVNSKRGGGCIISDALF